MLCSIAKYQEQIRDMFIHALGRDAFFYNVDPDPAIAYVMKEMNETYESMSNALEFGVRNGCPVEMQLFMFAEVFTIYLAV